MQILISVLFTAARHRRRDPRLPRHHFWHPPLPFSTCRRRRSSSDSFPSEGTRRRLIWQGDNLRRGKCQVVWFWQETVENVTITIRPDTKCWVLTGQNSDLWQIMNNDIIFYWIKCFFMDSFWYNVMFWMFVRLLLVFKISNLQSSLTKWLR